MCPDLNLKAKDAYKKIRGTVYFAVTKALG